MAPSTSFKQQCPSCEAMVPIRDPGLIGRKIDCPKCKYRFVVEEPAGEEEEADEKPAKKGKDSTAVTDKPGAKAKAAPAKKGAKGGPRRPDDEEEDRPKSKKKSGGSGVVILGVGLAAVAVLALAVGGYFAFFSG